MGAGRPGWVGVRVSAVWEGAVGAEVARDPGLRLWRGLQFEAGSCRGQSQGLTSVLGRGREGMFSQVPRKGPWEKAFLVGQAVRDAARVKNLKTLGFGVPTLWQLPALLCFEIL